MPSLGWVCLQRWFLRLAWTCWTNVSRSDQDYSVRQCLLRSTEVRCEFFRSLRILEDLECNFWKTDVKSWGESVNVLSQYSDSSQAMKMRMMCIPTCSGKTVLMTPSRMTMTSLLFKLGNWSISKSIARPALLVSLPVDRKIMIFSIQQKMVVWGWPIFMHDTTQWGMMERLVPITGMSAQNMATLKRQRSKTSCPK